jgi:hypothetical protein
VSMSMHGDHAYVLNALEGGSLHGYRVVDRRLMPIPGSHRALSLETTANDIVYGHPWIDDSRRKGHRC